jgi:hypothetical protein
MRHPVTFDTSPSSNPLVDVHCLAAANLLIAGASSFSQFATVCVSVSLTCLACSAAVLPQSPNPQIRGLNHSP